MNASPTCRGSWPAVQAIRWARALYLGQTVYRIHGTNQPQTIGHAVSSGCFRLVNEDVIDLYDRVPVGTKVIIKQAVAL